jgi:hypothetical protein
MVSCRYITPPGTGFLPRETAIHHQVRSTHHLVGKAFSFGSILLPRPTNFAFDGLQTHVLSLVKAALDEACTAVLLSLKTVPWSHVPYLFHQRNTGLPLHASCPY